MMVTVCVVCRGGGVLTDSTFNCSLSLSDSMASNVVAVAT